jgi:hypothetical protein
MEMHPFTEQYRRASDNVVLDEVAKNEYVPGPQTTERVTLAGEHVLIRRIPTLVAWSWFEDGTLYSVVANEVDPTHASNFVAALTAAQQAN